MKLEYDLKNKKAKLDVDTEILLEKGMEQHERTWKDKFNSKHSAKKEMLEIKHKQKLELEEQKNAKKNWIQKIQDNKLKAKELELEEKRRIEEELKKILVIKIILSIIFGIIGISMMIIGVFLGTESGNPDSPWHALGVFGLFPLMGAGLIWLIPTDNKK